MERDEEIDMAIDLEKLMAASGQGGRAAHPSLAALGSDLTEIWCLVDAAECLRGPLARQVVQYGHETVVAAVRLALDDLRGASPEVLQEHAEADR